MSLERDRSQLLTPLVRARRFDELLVANAALITGVFHVSIGLEATAAALAIVRAGADTVMLSHRNHAHLVALGSAPVELYRELLGRDNGLARGRAGSVHLSDPAVGVPYTSAMLGGGAAIGAGIALARRRRDGAGIVFACFGDGAMGEGVVYETLNLAAAWRLPIVFVCENNGPATTRGSQAGLADAHGVPAAVCDGGSPRAVLSALALAAGHARDGGGPRFVEAVTDPWPGNSTFIPHLPGRLDLSAPTASAGDRFAAADPVSREARELVAEGASPAALLALDERVQRELEAAFAAAAATPVAAAGTATECVWGSP
jgi:acetoin:2,6-dichlorophenolindophenol oxidoreductase subunit alpha